MAIKPKTKKNVFKKNPLIKMYAANNEKKGYLVAMQKQNLYAMRKGLGLTIVDIEKELGTSNWRSFEYSRKYKHDNARIAFLLHYFNTKKYKKLLSEAKSFFNIESISSGHCLKEVREKTGLTRIEAILLLNEYALISNPLLPNGTRLLENGETPLTSLHAVELDIFLIKCLAISKQDISFKTILNEAIKRARKWFVTDTIERVTERKPVTSHPHASEKEEIKKSKLELVRLNTLPNIDFVHKNIKYLSQGLNLSSPMVDEILNIEVKWEKILSSYKVSNPNSKIIKNLFLLKSLGYDKYRQIVLESKCYFDLSDFGDVSGDKLKQARLKAKLTSKDAFNLIYDPITISARNNGMTLQEKTGGEDNGLSKYKNEIFFVKAYVYSQSSKALVDLMVQVIAKAVGIIKSVNEPTELKTFQSRLGWVFKDKKVNRTNLAKKLHVPRQYVSYWVCEEKPIEFPKNKRKELAEFLGIGQRELFNFLNNGSPLPHFY